MGGSWSERVGTYMLSAFFGIVIGSIWYEQSLVWAYAAGMGAIVSGIAWLWRQQHARVACIAVTCGVLGAWHAAAYGSHLPPHIRPWNPNAVTSVHRALTSTSGWVAAQQSIRARIQTIYQGDEGVLLGGLLYGENDLSPSVKKQVRTAGLMHVLAVSGTNVTLLALMCMQALLALRLSRRSAYGALVVFTIAFVWLVRPSASVCRAAVMGLLLELAPLVGRVARPSRLFLIAATLFAWWQPFSVLYDPGFALSFLAMIGLMWWGPWCSERIKRFIPWEGMREIVAASLGTAILTAPYGLWLFGMWSAWGILTSVLILPIIPWLSVVGGWSLLIPIKPMIWMTHMGLRAMLDIVVYVSRYPGLVIETYLGFVAMLSVYAGLFVWWLLGMRNTQLIHKRVSAHNNEPAPTHASKT